MPSRPLGLILVTLCPQLPAAASFHRQLAWALARGASPGCGPARDQSWQGLGKEASRLPGGGSSAEAAAFMSLAGPQAAAAAQRLLGLPCSGVTAWVWGQRPSCPLGCWTRSVWERPGVMEGAVSGPHHPTANLFSWTRTQALPQWVLEPLPSVGPSAWAAGQASPRVSCGRQSPVWLGSQRADRWGGASGRCQGRALQGCTACGPRCPAP